MADFEWIEGDASAETKAFGGITFLAVQKSPSNTEIIVFGDPEGFYEYDDPDIRLTVQADLGTAKKLVEGSIARLGSNKFDTRADGFSAIEESLALQVKGHEQPQAQSHKADEAKEPIAIKKDKWVINNSDYSEVLSHAFANGETAFFRIQHGHDHAGKYIGLSCLPNDPSEMTAQEKFSFRPDHVFYDGENGHYDNLKAVKKLVGDTVNDASYFSEWQNPDRRIQFEQIKNFLHARVIGHQIQNEAQNAREKLMLAGKTEAAKRAGYVQGVCECVAAVGGDYALGSKLLKEMSVTKKMAKEYASPETFKALESGVFAQGREHKLERQQRRGHRR